MTDYRLPGGPRQEYFEALYRMSLDHGVLPGMVYSYLPALKHALGWNKETCLWFAFLNGMTQNPLTSLRLFERLKAPPESREELAKFATWFNEEWPRLQYDTDRRYAKKDTVSAIKSYCRLLHSEHVDQDIIDRQSYLYDADGGEWENLWDMVTREIISFGRLSSWSYLEYVRIYGSGLEPDTLIFEDKSGSRSHRNGMLFLCDMDHMVWDKRAGNGFDGKYKNYGKMCGWLQEQADIWQASYNETLRRAGANAQQASNFSFESALCMFKNSFFGRRYPGVYADLGWQRLEWYKANVGEDANYKLIRDIYATLPGWLQYGNDDLTIPQRGAIFPTTGVPYRAEHFLT